MTNPSFKENWVKIGYTDGLASTRAAALYTTGVPLPFDVYATLETSKCAIVEDFIHKTLDRFTDTRINPRREFFNITPQTAYAVLKDINKMLDDGVLTNWVDKETDICTTEKEILENTTIYNEVDYRKGVHKKGVFKFSDIGINIGDEIEYNIDGRKLKVVSDREIECDGTVYSLTGFVKAFLPNEKRCKSEKYRGPLYFSYNGQNLAKRWDREKA